MENTVVWLTGLSGAGKTTLALKLKDMMSLYDQCMFMEIDPTPVILIDGDELRKERPNLGFSKTDRESNVFHAVYKAFIHLSYNGGLVIVSLISPYKESRENAKKILKNYANARFIEVYVNTPLDVCESRDPKGLYKRAREGKLCDFTGIDSPYEVPDNPDIIITPDMSLADAVKLLHKTVRE
jgi:adenylyl-sulfate kinase